MAAGLLVLAAGYLATASAWLHLGPRDGAARLVGSFAFQGLAAALLIDAVVAGLRAVPVRVADAGGVRLRRPTVAEVGALLLRAAYLLVGLAFAASLLARDVFVIRLAEGEDATGAPEEFVDREPPRPLSPGPFPVSLTVTRVEGALRPDGRVDGLRVRTRGADGSVRTLRPWTPLWLGWGRFLVPARAGYAPRYLIARENGAPIESIFVKLDLLPAGTFQEVHAAELPHRIVFALAGGASLAGDEPALVASVVRGRLRVGEGPVGAGRAVHVDGLVLTVPEVRRWAELRMVRDPGIPILGFALLLAGAGAALSAASRRATRRPAAR